MDKDLAARIAELLQYSFEPVKWDYRSLSPTEKDIVGNQANLDEILTWVSTNQPSN